LLRPVHFAMSYLFTEIGSRWLVFVSVGLPFVILIAGLKLLSGESFLQIVLITTVYLLSLILAFLINFFFQYLLWFFSFCV
ncbi:ABC transporter permease, partial [Klebsiella pneumoniae]|nr:ABC transporter permease [Klebsiella pneumoniae]